MRQLETLSVGKAGSSGDAFHMSEKSLEGSVFNLEPIEVSGNP